MRRRGTRERILEVATDLFGRRGVDGASLDQIAAEVGVAKQTLLYWFPSKDELIQAVLEAAAGELGVSIDAAVRAADRAPLAQLDAVVEAVFRSAVRRPALLGLVRELHRLEVSAQERLRAALAPLVGRASTFLAEHMDRGTLRRGDPRLVMALCYATVTGIATEPAALRAVGWEPSLLELRRLRRELLAFLHAALTPGP